MAKLLLIHGARLVDRDMDVKNASLLVKEDKIEGIVTESAAQKLIEDGEAELFDAHGRTVMPSFIDMHAHFRDPGFTQKEDIESGCRAACAGGFGTVLLMPNTSPVISSQEQAEENVRKGEGSGCVQVIQGVSITKDFDGKTLSHLESLDGNVVPFISEDGHEVTDSGRLFAAMRIAARKNLLVSCHCEDPFLAAEAKGLRVRALEFLAANNGRPSPAQQEQAAALLSEANLLLELAEDTATLRNIELARKAGCRLHLCHVSTGRCVEAVKRAKKEGMAISMEITPHHIGMAGSKIPAIFHIVNPPLRSESDRDALIKALLSGCADVIATDHAPHTAEDKRNGSPGFSGLESAFAVCYTVLVKERGMGLRALSERLSARPAELLRLEGRGLLREGYEASLAVVDTEKAWTVRGEDFASKGKYTPFEGMTLTGQVQATFWRGRKVWER